MIFMFSVHAQYEGKISYRTVVEAENYKDAAIIFFNYYKEKIDAGSVIAVISYTENEMRHFHPVLTKDGFKISEGGVG